MKKLIGFVCAAALVAMMSMTVCAAPSVEAGKVPTGTQSTTSPSTGEPITLMVAGAAVVIGAAGAAVTTKKRA